MSLDDMAPPLAHQAMLALWVYWLVAVLVCVDCPVLALVLMSNDISPNAQSAGYGPLFIVHDVPFASRGL